MAFASKRVHINSTSNSILTFDRPAKEWRLIMYVNIILTVVLMCKANSTCTVNGNQYVCSNIATRRDFPLLLPENVKTVTLIGTHKLDHVFPSGLFNHTTWANVRQLSIFKFTNIDFIEKWFLNGLEELKVLSISSCTDLLLIHPDTFYSTPNIEELHLDGNTQLNLDRVEAALSDKLSNLRYLSLSGIQASERHIVLGDNFLKAVLSKNLTYLDMSGNNAIIVEKAVVQDLIGNLKYLNLSFSQTFTTGGMTNMAKSVFLNKNIELLDFTGVQYIILQKLAAEEHLFNVSEFPQATYLFMRKVIDQKEKVMYNIRLRFETCNIKFPKMVDFSKNSLTHLNITFIGACRPPELETLNLESNNMEYISPNFLSIFPSLKILDFSNNKLMKMQDVDGFSDMFSQNKDLEIVFLRNNYLTFVPANFFSSNTKLRIIDLSENELTYFDINIRNAENLTLINLSRNRIKHLSASVLEQFEPLLRRQKTESIKKAYATNVLLKQFQDKSLIGKLYRYGYNASEEIEFEESHSIIPQYLMINILENPFVCDCDALVFMEWILFTEIDIVNKTVLSCKYGNNENLLNNELFQMVQQHCRLAGLIGIAVASSFAIIFSIVSFSITIYLRRKSARQNKDLANLRKEMMQKNANFKFLVFLSFCSQDAKIVDTNILPSLNKYLQDILNTKRDLVCTGEDSFVPGMRIIEEIHRCINECLVVVPVITPAFLQSVWSQEECVAAVDRHRHVVVLMKKHTDTSKAILTIQNLIGQYTRGTWSDNEGVFDIRPSWNTICEGIIRAASESFRQYRRQNGIVPAEEHPLVK